MHLWLGALSQVFLTMLGVGFDMPFNLFVGRICLYIVYMCTYRYIYIYVYVCVHVYEQVYTMINYIRHLTRAPILQGLLPLSSYP